MKNSRRCGKTLIEMVFVIAVIGMVTTITGKTMVIILNKERSGRDAFVVNSDRNRLADDFRRDVNAAVSAGLSDEDDGNRRQLDLALPEGKRIQYQLADNELTRLEHQGEQLTRRERYRIGQSAAEFVIEQEPVELAAITMLIADGRPDHAAVHHRSLRIEAVIGKDLRFQSEDKP